MATAVEAPEVFATVPLEVQLIGTQRADRGLPEIEEIEEIELPPSTSAAAGLSSSVQQTPGPPSSQPRVPWRRRGVEPPPPPPPPREERPRRTTWARIKKVRLSVLFHWLLTWSCVFVFFSAVVDNHWRYFDVNRDALLLLHRSGELSAELLNTTISHTRVHTIYTECILDSKYSVINGSSLFYQPGCHSLLAELGSRRTKKDLIYVITTLMFIAPLMVFLALCAMSFLGIAYCTKEFRPLILLFTAAFRLMNTAFCVVMIICASAIGRKFQREDPGFPMPWPRKIRDTTTVYFLQPGMVDCIAGTLAQIAAIFLDIYESRKARDFTPRTARVSFHPVPHGPCT